MGAISFTWGRWWSKRLAWGFHDTIQRTYYLRQTKIEGNYDSTKYRLIWRCVATVYYRAFRMACEIPSRQSRVFNIHLKRSPTGISGRMSSHYFKGRCVDFLVHVTRPWTIVMRWSTRCLTREPRRPSSPLHVINTVYYHMYQLFSIYTIKPLRNST